MIEFAEENASPACAISSRSAASMDILISSNLERLLFDITGGDEGRVREWMQDFFRLSLNCLQHTAAKLKRICG